MIFNKIMMRIILQELEKFLSKTGQKNLNKTEI